MKNYYYFFLHRTLKKWFQSQYQVPIGQKFCSGSKASDPEKRFYLYQNTMIEPVRTNQKL